MDPSNYHPRPFTSDLDADDSTFRPPRRYFPDTYLDSPIMSTVREKWVSRLTWNKPEADAKRDQFSRTIRDVLALEPEPLTYSIVDPDEYPQMYHLSWQSTLDDELVNATNVAGSIYDKVSATVAKLGGHPLPVIPSLISSSARYWLSRWSYFDSLVEEYSRLSAASGPNAARIRLGPHTTVVATRDIWLLSNSQYGKYFLLYDQILMIKDLMFSRAQAHIAARAFYPEDIRLENRIIDLCNWHESCLTRHGNAGFEILKQTEALCKAYLSEMSDSVFGSDGPYSRMLQKVIDKERKLHTTDDFLAHSFDKVLRRCKSVQTVVELFGLLKVSGHPLIDARLGGISAAEEARSEDKTLLHDALQLDWEFKRVMLESYIRRYGAWPGLQFTENAKNTKLYGLYKAQTRGLNRSSYPPSDWEEFRFKKIVDFDYSPNYLDLIDDKSISLYRSNIAATWNSDVKPASHRRLLMELINRKTLDIKGIVSLIVRREVPFDWFIVSLHPKEREFKLAARMFSMLVLEIRIFFALTEANLADRIFPFLPQQTMTKSRVAIARQFLELTKPHSSRHSARMFIEIDLSRWNLRWRAMSVNPVARTLNDMFGTPGVFDFVHEFFSKSLILVRVRELEPTGINLPHPPESELLWYNHLGGFEGICQKLWTICTYSMISVAISDMPISYTLIGQADNQVLSIVTGKDSSKTDYDVLSLLRDEVTRRISTTCAAVNQEVKVEECLESTSVITYSKDVYVNGVYRPTALKFHSRLFPHSSQIFPSLRSNIGSIFATAVSGAEKSVSPMVSYYLACLYGGLYMYRVSKRRGPYGVQLQHASRLLGDRFNEFVMFCLTLPSEAGGWPVIPFLGFTYKGGSDPLGKSLASMNTLGSFSDSRLFNRMLAQLHSNALYNPEPKIATLLLDPFSIPIHKPQTPADGVAGETIAALAPTIKTQEIKELMSSEMTTYIDSLVDNLAACRPMNPLILRDILDCSIAGITETVSKMFVATRTLQNVVRELGVPVVDRVLHLEATGIAYMFNRFSALPNDVAPRHTTYELTQLCRNRWFPGCDNPIVGLTTYQPTDFTIQWGSSAFSIEGINSVLIADDDPINTRGPFDPYVGSKTREKRSNHGYKIVGTDSAARALRKLQLISSQTGDDPHFLALVDCVGWSRTNTTLSTISDLLPGQSGGTLSHRYAARAGHQDAFNIGSPNFATHVVISTDNMGYLSGGLYDYPHMIQEQVLYLNWTLQNRYLTTSERYISAVLVTAGTNLDPLPSVSIRGPDKLEMPVKRFTMNPLAFTPTLKLQQISGAVHHPSLPTADHYTPSPELRRHVIEAFFKGLMRKSSAGRQIADGSNQHFAGTCMDIAEARSNGLTTIAQCIANVACEEAISNYMLTDLQRVQRWRLQNYAMRVSNEMARAITPLVGHPLLRNDTLVRQLGLYDRPVYSGGSNIVHQRYVAYIVGLSNVILQGADTNFNHRSIGIFSSDNSNVLSETMLGSLLCDLYLWRLQNVIPSGTLRSLMGKKLIPVVRAHHDEIDKVDTLIRTASKLACATQLSSPMMSHILALYSHSRFKGYKASVEDVLKSTRDIDAWGLPTTLSSRDPKRLILPHSLPPPREFRMAKRCQTLDTTRKLDDTAIDKPTLLTNLYLRNHRKIGLVTGGALAVWARFADLFKRRPVIVIGCGLGAVARVALDNGCPCAYGLDMRRTIPLRSHRFRHYRPPLVADAAYESRYVQIPETFTSSGDWFDPIVQRAALSYDQGDATIVIDIQKGADRYGLEVLTPLLLEKTRGTIVLRLYLTETETCLTLADLHVSGATFKAYDVWRSTDIGHVVIILQSWPAAIVTAINPEVTSTCHPVDLWDKLEISSSDRALALSDAVFNVVYVAENQSVQDLEIAIDRLLDESWGDYDARLSHQEWTKWLRAKVCVKWALVPECERVPLLLFWHRNKEASIRTAGGHATDVDVSWDLCYHLASVVARLL